MLYSGNELFTLLNGMKYLTGSVPETLIKMKVTYRIISGSRILCLMAFTVFLMETGYGRQSGTTGAADYVPGVIVYKLENNPGQTLKGIVPDTPEHIRHVLESGGVRSRRAVLRDTGYREARMTALNRGLRQWEETPDDLTRTFIVNFDSGEDPAIFAAKISSLPGIEYAEPMFLHELTIQPGDPLISQQGHDYFAYHRFFGAWDVSKSSPDVIIAIVDSGVDYTHEDLQSKMWRNPEPGRAKAMFPDLFSQVDNDSIGWDFWQSGPQQEPVQSSDPKANIQNHGTHVAGTAAADTDNGIGIAGTGWNARYMVVKAGGTRQFPNIIGFGYQGILYAAANGADIINCSWGSSASSRFGRDIVKLATAMGSLIVAAAGNGEQGKSGSDQNFYPASFPEVLSVGSLDHRSGQKSGFSNYGYTVDVMAAGSVILSSVFNNQYRLKSGTSMATPVVSGLAALIRAHRPDWSPRRIATQIRATADPLDDTHNSTFAYKLGAGALNASAALKLDMPGVTVMDVDFVNMAGDKLDIGEEGQAVIRVKNFGATANHLTIRLESVIAGIDITKGTVNPGVLKTDSEIELRFDVKIRPDFNLVNTPVFLLKMNDLATTWSDFSAFRYENILYDIHDANKILTSVTTTGTIGFIDAFLETGGVGFVPFDESINDFSSESILFEGALMIETFKDTVGYILDQAREVKSISKDFSPVTGFKFTSPASAVDPTIGKGKFTTLKPGTVPHIDIDLETYSYNLPGLDKAILLKYSVTNLSGSQLNDTRAGLFNDWDIPPYNQNYTAFDQQGNFIYAYTDISGRPYAAVAHLGNIASAFAIDNTYTGVRDSLRFGLGDGFLDDEKSFSLRAGLGRTDISQTDVSIVTASGPYDIEPEATAVIGFIYAYGNSLDELREQIKNARGLQQFRVSSPGLVFKDDSPFSELPESTYLYPNYPNPFNPSTNIRYYLETGGDTDLGVYDLLGRRVATLAAGSRSQGTHIVSFNAAGLSSGIYFLVLEAAGTRQTRKMMLLR
jgi:serine protease